MKTACHSDPVNSSLSLINKICYLSLFVFSQATKWGCDHGKCSRICKVACTIAKSSAISNPLSARTMSPGNSFCIIPLSLVSCLSLTWAPQLADTN